MPATHATIAHPAFLVTRHSSLVTSPSDAGAFLGLLAALDQHPQQAARQLFDNERELFVTRAPGRLDVMGGIADYSGSLVLQLPLAEACFAAAQRDPARQITVVSLGADQKRESSFQMPLADFERDGRPVSYDEARGYFNRDAARHWAAYAAGAFLVLMRERGVRFDEGARLLLNSGVPEGKGVSSSAAVEVAAMSAVAAAFDVRLEARELALLCQRVENLVVGAPCGVMDQMTSAAGEKDQLLALLCQPAEVQGAVAIPPHVGVWGIDSSVRHSVGGGDYGVVRVAAFMGYRIIAAKAGLVARVSSERVSVDDPVWKGYLANINPSEFERRWAAHLPEQITGREFTKQYGGTTDSVTRIKEEAIYPVRVATAHPVYENFRVRAFAELLPRATGTRGLELLGELMYQSHASYTACGLGSPGTDRLVEMVRAAGPAEGLYGAKITGGGSGGTVAVLGDREADAAVNAIAEAYAREMNCQAYVFRGSSPGGASFGFLQLRRRN